MALYINSAQAHCPYTQTQFTLQYVLSYSQIHTGTYYALPLFAHTHAHTVSIWTAHAMSRDRASCTVNVSAVQMINVTWFTFPNVAQIPLSSCFTFCVEFTPGLQVKIATPPCSSLLSHNLPCLRWDFRPWWNWFYWEKGLCVIQYNALGNCRSVHTLKLYLFIINMNCSLNREKNYCCWAHFLTQKWESMWAMLTDNHKENHLRSNVM